MELQKNKMLSWLGCSLLLTVCTCNAVIAYAQGATCTVQTFQPTAPLPTPAGWMPPASGQTQPIPPALIPVKWSGTLYVFNIANGWGGRSVNASLQFDTPDAACQSLLIYQSWAGNLYCVNAKAGPLPGWGYQGNCSCADPNTRGLYEPGCPSGSIPANDSLGGVACRTVNANLIRKPSDGICNMIAQGNTFIADNGGGFNGGDPDCNSACTVQCPTHASGTPCVCNTGYHFDAAGTSCVQDEYTLTLNNPAGDIEPSGTAAGNGNASKAMTVRVNNKLTSQPKDGARVRITLGVQEKTGGHEHHDAQRPKGSLKNCNLVSDGVYDCTTGPDGYADVTFNAPEVSGTHTVKAECISPACSITPPPETVNVKVAGLLPIPASQFYTLTEPDGRGVMKPIGSHENWHTDNHNMTYEAAQKLVKLAEDYHRAFSKDPVLHLNDASLPQGGVYDFCARPGACSKRGIRLWTDPHKEHRRGTVIDVRANGTTGSIPQGNFTAFAKLIRRGQMTFLHEDQNSSNEHFHIRLLGRSE